ncbi:MAG: class I SAM-dependent methyltransferase [Promethearchaeota archaeon]
MNNMIYKWDAQLYQKSSTFQFNLGMMAIERLNSQKNEIILDIGCGNAMVTIELAKKIPYGKIIGIEISKEQCELAKKNLDNHRIKNIEIINIDAIKINFENKFDAVFSNSAIHWIRDLKLIYKLIYKSLKKGGRILIQTGLKKISPIFPTLAKIVRHNEFQSYFKNIKIPWRFLSVKENQKILEGCNFRDIEIEPFDYTMEFKDKNDVINYWKAAGLVPFLSALPDNLKKKFIDIFKKIYFKMVSPNILEYNMTRLFISAKK